MADDPGQREAIGQRAREFARAHDMRPAIDAYERLLGEVATRGPALPRGG
jgi:hypothetical protein